MNPLYAAVLLAAGATWVVADKSPAPSQPHAWWKEAVVYQVYPPSFKETRTTDAIGWGDINGITDNLDHIQSLGTDIVWLSPFYDSPLKDVGYDISNYDSVDPHFGGMIADVKRFIAEVHRRGMRCIFDLVINHTSNEHPWFVEANSSRTNDKRDWYIWRDPKYVNGTMVPPNNWSGTNNGSAWKYEAVTGQYYLNIFNYFQPDMNWENPDTRQAIFHSALDFWIDMDIDGFRLDAFAFFSKPAGLPDVPTDIGIEPNPQGYYVAQSLYTSGPHEHEYLHQMNRETYGKYDSFTVGEYGKTYNMTEIQNYVGASRQEVNTAFLTNMCDIGRDGFKPVPFNFTGTGGWRDAINFTQAVGSPAAGDGWNSVYLENHDLPRSISRFANDSKELRVQSGKALAMMLSTLSGTLFVYQGQELGMVNVPTNWTIDDFRDFASLNVYTAAEAAGENLADTVYNLTRLARDNARTPFNWDRSGNFSANATTWTPTANLDINLADQLDDPASVYAFWKRMIDLRKARKDLFVYGAFKFLDLQSEDFLIYQKTGECGRAVVYINFSAQPSRPSVEIPAGAELLAHTHMHDCSSYVFEPYEGRVYKC